MTFNHFDPNGFGRSKGQSPWFDMEQVSFASLNVGVHLSEEPIQHCFKDDSSSKAIEVAVDYEILIHYEDYESWQSFSCVESFQKRVVDSRDTTHTANFVLEVPEDIVNTI